MESIITREAAWELLRKYKGAMGSGTFVPYISSPYVYIIQPSS